MTDTEQPDPRQSVVDELVAERYGRSVWWKKSATSPPALDMSADNDLTTAARRRALAAEWNPDRQESER